MKLAVISLAPLIRQGDRYHAYGPYIKEMEIWARYADSVSFVCPIWESDRGLLCSPVNFKIDRLYEAKDFNVKSGRGIIDTVRYSIHNFKQLYRAMRDADHIHLRCPGNLGLMGCLVQILFPNKKKTAKYAGNWDPDAKQPFSYKLQRWILSNTFLTRNMQVLVYGQWPNSTRNIKPFFTATYRESQIEEVSPRDLSGEIKFLFVGMLSPGKRPLYALQIVEGLKQRGYNVSIDFYGEGTERDNLEQAIAERNFADFASLKGNRDVSEILMAYKSSHFLLLPSKSEGWPKVVAEAMFWGCVPIATGVSCVPYMLANGQRGLLIDMNLNADVDKIASLLDNQQSYDAKVAKSIGWSRQFTLDLFEKEIKALLQ